ncbi:MAG: heavy metal-binding domain-containing protein [Bilophila sp.]
MASKSTLVTTPEGEEVQVNFNMGTGEVTYGSASCCTDKDDEKPTTKSCCCSKKA